MIPQVISSIIANCIKTETICATDVTVLGELIGPNGPILGEPGPQGLAGATGATGDTGPAGPAGGSGLIPFSTGIILSGAAVSAAAPLKLLM